MSLPLLSWSMKRECSDRYLAGEAMPALAEAYGCATGVIRRALIQTGTPRRSAEEASRLRKQQQRQTGPVRCRECGDGCDPNAVRPLCTRCVKAFCTECDTRLRAGWHGKLCSDCKFRARYKRQEPRLCRICGRLAGGRSRRLLCGVHRRWFCSACDGPLPPTRVNHRCTECEAKRMAEYYARPGSRCAQCGAPRDGNHASRCRKCVAEEYEVRRWASLHHDRPCRECGERLPRGRLLVRCARCERKRVARGRLEREKIGAHRCAMCHDPLPLTQGTYCSGCSGMLAKWRKAWHDGCEVARQLGTVRALRRWQRAGAAEQDLPLKEGKGKRGNARPLAR